MKLRVLLGSLCLGIAALHGAAADAATCALRSSSGTCLFWSNGVAAQLVTDSQGSLAKSPTLTVLATPAVPATPYGATASGVIACANKGSGNTAPGIQTVFIPDVTAYATLDSLQFLTGAPVVKSEVSKNVATVAPPDAVLSTAQLGQLVANCPNAGWKVVDFVPCSATMQVNLDNSSGALDSASLACTLDYPGSSCSTLAWNGASQVFEKRPYACTLR